MIFWMTLWKIVLIAGILLFAGMAVWVTIGGFFDIKRLLANITETHQRDADQESHPN